MAKLNIARWVIPLLLVIFITPPLSAWLVFKHVGAKHTVQHGQLLQPPQNISSLVISAEKVSQPLQHLQGKWWLIYVNPSVTSQTSLDNLYKLRQVHLALGKNINRVERLLLIFNNKDVSSLAHSKLYTGILIARAEKQTWKQLLGKDFIKQEAIYILDPAGNLILKYPTNVTPKALHQDLARLLEVSRIG